MGAVITDAAVAACLTGTHSKLWSLFAVLKCLLTAERHTLFYFILFYYCAALQSFILVTYFQSRTALLCESDLLHLGSRPVQWIYNSMALTFMLKRKDFRKSCEIFIFFEITG